MNSSRCAILFALGFMLAHIAAPAQKKKTEPITAQQLWSTIKSALTNADGQEYFDNSLAGRLGSAASIPA
jgi:hypothetical protein